MKIDVIINQEQIPVNVPEHIIQEAQDFFAILDKDLDKGALVDRSWYDNINLETRCKIVADRLLTSIVNQKEKPTILYAAYILSKVPNLVAIDVDNGGNILDTEFIVQS